MDFTKPPYLFCKLSLFCEPNGSVAPFGAVRTLKRQFMYVRKKGNKRGRFDKSNRPVFIPHPPPKVVPLPQGEGFLFAVLQNSHCFTNTVKVKYLRCPSLSIFAFFTPFGILYLSKICRFTAYILTIVKKIVAHNSSHYLFAILN